jgi:hypothetical protein
MSLLLAANTGSIIPISGSATETLSSLTVSALGTEIFSGTATETLSSLTVAAVGVVPANFGDATISLSSLTAAANGEEIFSGTVTETFSSLTVVAVGSQVFSGTVSETFSTLTIAASGLEEFGGTVSEILSSLTVDANGTVTVNSEGTADIILSSLTVDATGEEIFSGSLSTAFGPLATSANGELVFSGSTIGQFSSLTINSIGSQIFQGNVLQTLSSLIVASTVSIEFSGTAEATLSSLAIDSVGEVTEIQYGDVTFNSLATAASGSQIFEGSATETFNSLQVDATAEQIFAGDITATISKITVNSVGSEIFDGSGVVSIGSLSNATSGSLTFDGQLDINLPSLTVAANGHTTQPTGDASVAFSSLTGFGRGKQMRNVPSQAILACQADPDDDYLQIYQVESAIGHVSLTLPPGAVNSATTIFLYESTPTNIPTGYILENNSFTLETNSLNVIFATGVTIEIPGTINQNSLLLTRSDQFSEWSIVPGATKHLTRSSLIAKVYHFSEFVVATPNDVDYKKKRGGSSNRKIERDIVVNAFAESTLKSVNNQKIEVKNEIIVKSVTPRINLEVQRIKVTENDTTPEIESELSDINHIEVEGKVMTVHTSSNVEITAELVTQKDNLQFVAILTNMRENDQGKN